MKKQYSIAKSNYNGEIVLINYEKLDGYHIVPRNKIEYSGIKVNSMVIVKPSFIEKILTKKTQKKLEYYLQYIISMIDDEDQNPDDFRQVLDSLERYKSVVEYKYQKYLDDKFIDILLKKISLMEKEIKQKQIDYYLRQQRLYREKMVEEPELSETRRRSR